LDQRFRHILPYPGSSAQDGTGASIISTTSIQAFEPGEQLVADLLILDEPTDGLDPAAIEDVLRELVGIAASLGTTMFFSSHH